MTLGSLGSLAVIGKEATLIKSHPIEPPIDIVGAGDTFLAAVSLSMAVTEDLIKSAEVATLASEVTIKKIRTTGTASEREILQRFSDNCQ